MHCSTCPAYSIGVGAEGKSGCRAEPPAVFQLTKHGSTVFASVYPTVQADGWCMRHPGRAPVAPSPAKRPWWKLGDDR